MSKRQEQHIWTYRGRRLLRIEWGLWKSLDDPIEYFLCYRAAGDKGTVTRQFAYLGPRLDEHDLRDHCREIRAQITAAKAGIDAGRAIAELRDTYLADARRRQLSDKHLDNVENAIDGFIACTSASHTDDLTVDAVDRYLQSLADRSPRTQNKNRGILGTWFSWAIKRGWLATNPINRTDPVTEAHHHPQFPMPRELLQIIRASAPYDRAIYTLLALTGLRWGSLASLDHTCFSDTGITVPHTKRGQEWLIRYDDGCPLWSPELSAIGRRIFTDPAHQPLPAAYERIADSFVAASIAVGPRYTLHGLRHAFCSWQALMGESIEDIAAWTHHATPLTTQRNYVHLRPHGQDRVARNRRYVFTCRSHMVRHALILDDRK